MLINQYKCNQCYKDYKNPIIFSCSFCKNIICYDCYNITPYKLCQICNHQMKTIYHCNLCNQPFKQKENLTNLSIQTMYQLTNDYLRVLVYKLHGKHICRSCMFIDTEIVSNYREKNNYNCKFCGTFSTKNNKYVFKLSIKFLCQNGLFNYKKFFLCENHINKLNDLKFQSIDYDQDNNQWCQKKMLKTCDGYNCDKLIRNDLLYCKNMYI